MVKRETRTKAPKALKTNALKFYPVKKRGHIINTWVILTSVIRALFNIFLNIFIM